MLKLIDRWLNKITMYRLVMYVLALLAAAAMMLAWFGISPAGGLTLAWSLALVVGVCYAANLILAKLWRAPVNPESALISALIIFFLFSPATDWTNAVWLAAAGVLAMLGKYLLAWRGRHILNPVAAAAVILSFTNGAAIWWVGNVSLLPLTLLAAWLIVRKTKRQVLVNAAIVANVLVISALAWQTKTGLPEMWWQNFASGAIIFLVGVMLTEPLTRPPRHWQQLLYGAVVGAVAGWPFHFGALYSTPELALVLGNLMSYGFSLKSRLVLTLRAKVPVANNIYEFSFSKPNGCYYQAGQYLEWTLPHARPDERGSRRYFTIASSPTEDEIKLGVKFNQPSSSFKRTLLKMEPGAKIYAGSLAGDFVLPRTAAKKLVFIAGGVGITPFRSMLKYLLDKGERWDIILIYSARAIADVAYGDILAAAEQASGLKIVLALNEDGPAAWPKIIGRLDAQQLRAHISDYKDRWFYLSGPSGLVDSYQKLLLTLEVPAARVKTDYFPGF